MAPASGILSAGNLGCLPGMVLRVSGEPLGDFVRFQIFLGFPCFLYWILML